MPHAATRMSTSPSAAEGWASSMISSCLYAESSRDFIVCSQSSLPASLPHIPTVRLSFRLPGTHAEVPALVRTVTPHVIQFMLACLCGPTDCAECSQSRDKKLIDRLAWPGREEVVIRITVSGNPTPAPYNSGHKV